jgi:predicted RecB family nuclease
MTVCVMIIPSMPAPALIRISKSKFVAGIQCLRRLYFQIHQPELAEEADQGQEARLEQGQEVGLFAQRRFAGGVFVGFEAGVDEALANTAALMNDMSVAAIFEATFQHSSLLLRVDILQRRPRNRWRLIEVKSSLEMKQHYLYDVAIQHHVLSACGLDISSACLMHLDRDYRYDGNEHDLGKLFTVRDLTKQVRKLDADLPGFLKAQRKVLAQAAPPEISPGPQCMAPYQCEFFSHCNPEPPEHHISFLPRLSVKKREALLELGVSLIHEIPEDFPLTELQARMCASVATRQTWVSKSLQQELSKLKYPLCFMDFETIYPAIPRFIGMWPYSQIPFQWSVHRQLAPAARLEHFEYLAGDERDPRPDFIESLCAALGKRGQIVVYNAGFESRRLAELADALPEYKEPVRRIRGRMWDLLPFVRRHVYHPEFRGSFSIKSVLPALVPGMTYEGMEVADGNEAGLAWEQIIRGGLDPDERQQLKTALLGYCEPDTLAMVKILDNLRGTRTVGGQE